MGVVVEWNIKFENSFCFVLGIKTIGRISI